MDIRAEFKNGACKLFLTPSDKWEQELIGSIAKGGDTLDAVVKYESEGHFSYGKCAVVEILLNTGEG